MKIVNEEVVGREFAKCTEPIFYSQKYKYFKTKYQIAEPQEVLTVLKYIEKLSLRGALYIAILKEKGITEGYVKKLVARNREALIDGIQIDNDNIVVYMQTVYMCLMYLDKEEGKELSKAVFSGDVYKRPKPVYTEYVNPKAVTNHYVNVFLSAVTKFGSEIEWKKKYCDIATWIYEARDNDPDFLLRLEVGLRKNPLGYVMNDETARRYFDLLCGLGIYDAARFFLDNFDGSQGFIGMEMSEFTKYLFSLPDPGMLSFAKWCSGELVGEEYTYDEWCRDVETYNNDTDCIKWIRLTKYFRGMKEAIEAEDTESFKELLSHAGEYELFDLDRIKYMKQLVEDSAFILSSLLRDGAVSATEYLRKIDRININRYDRIEYLKIWNKKDTVRDDYDYGTLMNALCSDYSVEDMIFIYMNSHLKAHIYIENFVKKCADKAGEELYEYFKDYPLTGTISLGYRLASVRDKMFITATNVATDASYSDYANICETEGARSVRARSFNKKMIRSYQRWYSYNKKEAELFRTGDECTFYIFSYRKSDGILATDIKLPQEIIEKRDIERDTVFPGKVIDYFEKIRTCGRNIRWNENDSVYGTRHLEDMETRIRIAIDILDTMIALKDDIRELDYFVGSLTNPPLEELNEFRYISNQRTIRFDLPEDRVRKIRFEIIEKTGRLLKNETIPASIRKDIYLNTVARKYFDLQEACKKIGSELYLKTAEEPLVMALKFEEKKGNEYFFSTRGRNNTFYSHKRFVYRGTTKSELVPGEVYLVALDDHDSEANLFTLAEVALKNEQTDQWDKYLRKVRDIKKTTNDGELEEIKRDLKRYNIRITSGKHLMQFVYELHVMFEGSGYNIENAIKILGVISDTNPFEKKDFDFSPYVKEIKEKFGSDYEGFLNEYRNNYKAPLGFSKLYYRTYLKAIADEATLAKNLADERNKEQDILNCCALAKSGLK